MEVWRNIVVVIFLQRTAELECSEQLCRMSSLNCDNSTRFSSISPFYSIYIPEILDGRKVIVSPDAACDVGI